MARQARWRARYTFWLDVRRDDERALALLIDSLKARRAFKSTVMDALLLMDALQSGSTARAVDALDTAAPWFVEWMRQNMAKEADVSALRARVDRLESRVAALERGARFPASDDASLLDDVVRSQNFTQCTLALQRGAEKGSDCDQERDVV